MLGNKMKKSKVDEYLGKYVGVMLVDDFVYRGMFKKTECSVRRTETIWMNY